MTQAIPRSFIERRFGSYPALIVANSAFLGAPAVSTTDYPPVALFQMVLALAMLLVNAHLLVRHFKRQNAGEAA